MFGLECVPVLFFAAALLCIPRSPRWLVQVGLPEEGFKVLARIGGEENAKFELQQIQQVLQEERASKVGTLAELFSPGIRTALLIGVALAFFQQWTGVSPIGFYTPVIFQKAGFESATDALFLTMILYCFSFVCVWCLRYGSSVGLGDAPSCFSAPPGCASH